MAKPDPIRAEIVSRFARFDVTKVGGGYTLCDRRDGSRIARLKPVSQTSCELFYWSLAHEKWRPFGPFGPMPLSLDEIHEIIENESLFRRHSSLLGRIQSAVLRRIFR
jgi:hypothetical protein